MIKFSRFCQLIFLSWVIISCQEEKENRIDTPLSNLDLPSINYDNQNNYVLGGECGTSGSNVIVEIDLLHSWTTSCDGSKWSISLDLTAIDNAEEEITIRVTIDDHVTFTQSIKRDVIIPEVSFSTIGPPVINSINQHDYSIGGECSEAGKVDLSTGSLDPVTVDCIENHWQINQNISSLSDDLVTFSLNITDESGNISTTREIKVARDIQPPFITITTDRQSAHITSQNKNEYSLEGRCEGSESVGINIGQSFTREVACDQNIWSLVNQNVENIEGGSRIRVLAKQEDFNGNVGQDEIFIIRDITPPVLRLSSNLIITLNNVDTYELSGRCEGDIDVEVRVGTNDVQRVPCRSLQWSMRVEEMLPDGHYPLVITQKDEWDNNALLSPTPTLAKDTLPPAIAIDSNLSPINFANQRNYTIQGTCNEANRPVRVSLNGAYAQTTACNGTHWEIDRYDTSQITTGNSVEITAIIQDEYTNQRTAVPVSVMRDIDTPQVTIITMNTNINFNNNMRYNLSGSCENNLDVLVKVGTLPVQNLDCNLSIWNLVNYDTTDLPGGDGYILVVIQTDTADNEGRSQIYFDKDITPPNVTISSNFKVNKINQSQFSLRGTCSEEDTNIGITLALNNPVQVPCKNSKWVYENIDLSNDASYPQGFIDLVVTQRDHVGNEFSLSGHSIRLNKDTIAPVITLDAPRILNIDNKDNYFLQGNCSEGDMVSVSLQRERTNYQSSCSGERWQTTIGEHESLPDESIPFSITAQDGNDNTQVFTGDFKKDTDAPTLTMNSGLMIIANNLNGFILAGTCSDEGSVVTLQIATNSPQTDICTGNQWEFSVPSTLAEGTYSLSISHRDNANNTTVLTPTPKLIKDITLPTFAFNISNNINAANVGQYYVAGTCDEPGEVAVSVAGSSVLTASCTGSIWKTANPFNAFNLPEGPVILNATMMDTIGNSAPSRSHTVTKNTSARAVSINNLDTITLENKLSYSISGSCSSHNGSISITIGTIDMTATCNNGRWSTASFDVSNLSEGTVNILALFGPSEDQARDGVNVQKDTIAPTISINSNLEAINLVNQGGYTIRGSCNETGTVRVSVGSLAEQSTRCNGSLWELTGYDARLVTGTTIPITASISDQYMNQNSANVVHVDRDIIAPRVTIETTNININAENEENYALTGNCENNLNVSIKVGSLPTKTVSCENSSWSLANYDTTALLAGQGYTLLVSQIDAARNKKIRQRSFEKDTVLPTLSLATTSLNINNANQNSFSLRGNCSEVGRNVIITIASSNPVRIDCENTGWVYEEINLSDDSDYPQGPIAMAISHTDSVGNQAQLIGGSTLLSKDTIKPLLTLDAPGILNRANHQNYTLRGDCEDANRVILIVQGEDSNYQSSCLSGRWEVTIASYSSLDAKNVSVTILSKDSHENRSVVFGSFFADIIIPQIVISSGLFINFANKDSFVFTGSCTENSVPVNLQIGSRPALTDTCLQGRWNFSIPLDLAEGAHLLTISQKDSANNVGEISPKPTLVKDTQLPDFSFSENLNISVSNMRNYIIHGTCQENGSISVIIPDHINETATCSRERTWSTQIINILFMSDGEFSISATMTDLVGNSKTITKDITKSTTSTDEQSPVFSFDSDSLSITKENQEDYKISGTCQEDGDISIQIPYNENIEVGCVSGVWESQSLNGYNIPLGGVTLTAIMTNQSGDTNTKTAVINNTSTAYFPYYIITSRSYNDALPENLPHNYLARIAIPPQSNDSSNWKLKITSIDVEGLPGDPSLYSLTDIERIKNQWKPLFQIDTKIEDNTGILYLSDQQSTLRTTFNHQRSSDLYRISDLLFMYSGGNLVIPNNFILRLSLENSDSVENSQNNATFSLNVNVSFPKFGKKDCEIISWNDDLGTGPNAWTETEVKTLREKSCQILDYGFTPRGIKFKTTQEDIDALPDGLSQEKGNYKIIFKDDFSKARGLDKLDHRRWLIYNGRPCNSYKAENGVLTLEVNRECLSGSGRLTNATLMPMVDFKYGYFEVRFSQVPRGREISTRPHGGFLQWYSYPRSPDSVLASSRPQKSFFNFVCRGNSAVKKRARWLNAMGVEKQYIETKYWGLSAGSVYNYGWWVFHSSSDNNRVKNCHRARPPIYSGVLWDNLQFRPRQSYKVGMEWTPSGYRVYSDGRPIQSYHGPYGYSTPTYTGIYSYVYEPIPASGLINQTVSHAYQGMGFSIMPPPGSLPANYPEGWKDSIKIDYVRVYQPTDGYASETKSYE